MSTEAIVAQLTTELGDRLYALAVLEGPDAVLDAHVRTDAIAVRMALLLRSGDDNELAGTVVDVLNALWPDDCEPPPEWWRTPVGRVAARSLGTSDADAVTQSVAAAMLGVTRGTVAQLVHRGTLDRHPDGGVTRASVLLRIGRQTPPTRDMLD